MYELTRAHDFRLILAYHTQGEIIYWKFMDFDPPRALEIGEMMSEASGYPLELTPEFSSYAGYKDWFIQTYNLPGYILCLCLSLIRFTGIIWEYLLSVLPKVNISLKKSS